MLLLVLAYPQISEENLTWIQSVRDRHDELYAKVVAPHFTLVFPADIEAESLIQHVELHAKDFSAFEFTLKCALIVKDSFSDYTHVFLVPDQGYSDVVKLHDRLYSEILEKELRLDIPFIPHIGIANSLNAQSCKKLADELNQKEFAIKGRIETLDVVLLEDNKVSTIQHVRLLAKNG